MADLAGRRLGLAVATTAGGTGRHVRAVADAAVGVGADVVVAGPATTESSFRFTDGGSRFRAVEIVERLDPLRDALAWRAAKAALADRELVHAHGLRAGLVAGLALPRAMPLVVTWHNAVLRGGAAARLLAAAERRVARRATVTLCVSADLAARAEALGARDVRIAPVGSSRLARSGRPVSEVRADLGVGADEALVLTVGRLHAQKGLDVLVRASVDVAAAVGPVRFVLAGDGPARADLAAQVDRLGAPVILAGWRDDAGDLLAAADLVVMPSRWEGSPLAAHETLLAGRPLVATAVGGLPELLDGGAALLVPADDVDALAAAVLRLLRDPGEREALAARGAARAQGWPDSAAAAAAVLGVYRELLP